MATKVVNLRKSSYDVYIGRAGKGHDGYFGNPVRKGFTCPVCGAVHESAGDTIPCYTIYFESRLRTDSSFRDRVLALKGKTLGCFCKPGPCHGDVIASYVDRTSVEVQ